MNERETGSRWAHLTWIRATDDPDPESECIEVAAGEGDLVHIRQTDDPENVVTTTQAKWHAFVLGVRNDEFDHFVEEPEAQGAHGSTASAGDAGDAGDAGSING